MKVQKRKYVKIYLLIAILFSTFISSAQEPIGSRTDYSELIEELDKSLQKDIKKHNIVGMSISLIDGKEIVWSKGFGYEDKENRKKASAKTNYSIGSITKLFTATAVMQLQEQKKLNIDSSFKSYMTEFNINSEFGDIKKIIPRHMLHHHSGLPGDYLYGWCSKDEHFTQLISKINHCSVTSAPNYAFNYSNLGYSLLGSMVQKVSNTKYESFISSNIFASHSGNDFK